MIVTCWSVKGGSGTSVVAGGLAVAWSAERRVLAVDLAGDLPALIGLESPPGPGVVDWLHAGSGVGTAALHALAVDAGRGLRVLHRGGTAEAALGGAADDGRRSVPAGRWTALAEAMAAVGTDVVIDAGLAPLPPELAAHTDASLLVIRPCFLALRRLSAARDVPAGAVVINEPGRALGRRDIERVLGIRIAAEMRIDPAVARAVDAGLLASRLPSSLAQLARAVDRWAGGPAVNALRPEPLPGFAAPADTVSLLAALAGAPDRTGEATGSIGEGWR